mmetsp:Transcript_30260/g.63404  ORF Transcript_30260/g.63404 Transcript_30260/m.63404 type:complete len:379 (+) Transcript_30260:1097-2233(+)
MSIQSKHAHWRRQPPTRSIVGNKPIQIARRSKRTTTTITSNFSNPIFRKDIHHQLPPGTRTHHPHIPHETIHQFFVLFPVVPRIQHHHHPPDGRIPISHPAANRQSQRRLDPRLHRPAPSFEEMRRGVHHELFPGGDAGLVDTSGETASRGEGEFFGIASEEGVVEYLIFREGRAFHVAIFVFADVVVLVGIIVGGRGSVSVADPYGSNDGGSCDVGPIVLGLHEMNSHRGAPRKTQSTRRPIPSSRSSLRHAPRSQAARQRRRRFFRIPIGREGGHPEIDVFEGNAPSFDVGGYDGEEGRGELEVGLGGRVEEGGAVVVDAVGVVMVFCVEEGGVGCGGTVVGVEGGGGGVLVLVVYVGLESLGVIVVVVVVVVVVV